MENSRKSIQLEQFQVERKKFNYDTREFIIKDIPILGIFVRGNFSTWTPTQKSNYIESLLLGVPTLSVILLQEQGLELVAHTHQEEILAIKEFLEGSFKLKSNKILTELEELNIDDLPGAIYRKVISTPLRFIILGEEVEDETVEYLKTLKNNLWKRRD